MHALWVALLQQGTTILVQMAILVVLFLLRTLKAHLQTYVVAHTTTQQRQLLAQLGQEAFSYAETVYQGLDGPAKLNEATKYLLDKANTTGLGQVQLQDARAVIESAWLADQRLLQTASSSGSLSPNVAGK